MSDNRLQKEIYPYSSLPDLISWKSLPKTPLRAHCASSNSSERSTRRTESPSWGKRCQPSHWTQNLPRCSCAQRSWAARKLRKEFIFKRISFRSTEFLLSEEIITIISILSGEAILMTPALKREEAIQARKKFSASEGDHVMYLKVFRAFSKIQPSEQVRKT